MCGIFAAFNIENCILAEQELIDATKVASHRGPDNIGYFNDGFCFLGHTRLSILGLETQSNQPLFYEDLVIIFNGEVFNYIELREELRALNYTFETNSDTEVVIKSFHGWGNDCFTKFNGMWAIVIYNRKNRTLTVSRDRFGQKPIFVMQKGNSVFFSSEFQQLAPLSDKEIDYELIQKFLQEGTYEGGGRTFFKGIEEFPKVHYCEIDAAGHCASFRYWDYWSGEIWQTDASSFSKFSELLQDAIRVRLRADVPFGILLSEGTDSTIIAAYARKYAGADIDIPAFTYRSRDKFDESGYAEKIANKLHMSLTIREQPQEAAEYKERLARLVKHMGRGHSSPAIVSVDFLYQSVAEAGIKVALDGQGSDELLAGYKNYFMLVIPWFFFRGKFIQAYYCLVDQFRFGFTMAIILYLRNILPSSGRRLMRISYDYERFFRKFSSEPRKEIVVRKLSKVRNSNALNRYLIWHHSLGLENLLFYGDIVAMRTSVENRAPFMDHRLVDFVFQHDEKLKLYNAIDKYAIRTLPIYREFKDTLDREKIGFSSDIKKETKLSIIEKLRSSSILKWPIFTQSLSTFLMGEGMLNSKYERFLFRLYQVHLWDQIFMQSGAAIARDWGSLQDNVRVKKNQVGAMQ
ncbi:MAG: asparagine synthase (glutamine-hydrolyzing) [Sphingomonadales bacterium]|nr:asparagine synthase (glutamine-hydrolyzing) [Sphingomonadales bacterium]